MLSLRNVTLRRGKRVLFQDASFNVHPGQKVAVTGANGTGKSSLFAVLRGELGVDAGEMGFPEKWVIAHVAQETPAVEGSAADYTLDGDAELRGLEREIAQAEARSDPHLGELHARYHAIGGYTARARAGELLHGLGFTTQDEARPVHTFSGGWRMRLNLARALMRRSDLLLLDEPTNHLDLDAVLWLEQWLLAYPGTLLLISHDREFIDAVAGAIVHIEHATATLYTGNYSDFEQRRAQRLLQQQAAYKQQQNQVAHLRSYVDRFRAQATKARQAQSRLKALERMELIAPAHVDAPFHFMFREALKLPQPLLSIEHAEVQYGERTVIRNVNCALAPGDRVGLLGANGAGKSTLVKLLAGQLSCTQGARHCAPDTRIGYFAQHQLEQLHAASSPLQHVLRLDPRVAEQELRDFLGGFGFNGEAALAPVGPMSGGEKARLVLALLVYQRPNLLLLDEPTNHLDLEMRHALTVALQDFSGAMVIVSHDRYLLRAATDRWLLVAEGVVRDFDGDLEDYRAWLAAQRRAQEATGSAHGVDGAGVRKERKRNDAERRQRLAPLRKRVQELEAQLTQANARKTELECVLADAGLYTEPHKQRLKEILAQQSKLLSALHGIEEAWLQASEELESAQRAEQSE